MQLKRCVYVSLPLPPSRGSMVDLNLGATVQTSRHSDIHELLEERRFLVADGGMGTVLFASGLENGDSPELWNVDHPDRITSVHRAYVDAGADILLTNTFGGTAPRFTLHGLRDRCSELNESGARLARSVADEADRTVLVAGSMGPTGELFAPVGELGVEDGTRLFEEQAKALIAGGVDLLWIETMYSIEELTAAHAAAARFGIPIVATMSFDSHGHTMMGVSPAELNAWSQAQDVAPSAVGANCGIGPKDALLALAALLTETPEAITVAKSNCGAPALQGLDVTYPIGPDGMTSYAATAMDLGVRIIGACCGSTPEHVRAIRRTVDSHTPGRTPTTDDITTRLGALDDPISSIREV